MSSPLPPFMTRVPEELQRTVKAQAAMSGMTIQEAVTEALENWVQSKMAQLKTSVK